MIARRRFSPIGNDDTVYLRSDRTSTIVHRWGRSASPREETTTMTTNILVPIDGSAHSYGGVVYAARSFPSATITALYVVDVERDWYQGPGMPGPWEEVARETAEGYHERAIEWARQYDTDIETETVFGVPHRQILEHVVDHDIDHVVMGSHGRSPITRPFVGHVAEAVARRAPVSVTIVPETVADVESWDLPGRILVAVDGSDRASMALEYALSRFPGASITIVHAIDLGVDYDHEDLEGTYVEELLGTLRERADELLAAAAEHAADHDGDVQTAAIHGKPAPSIVSYGTENGFDQIVMGSHGRSGLGRVLLGSVAEAVAQRSPISVTIVRE